MAHRHLTLSDRYCIQNLLELGYSNLKIANKVAYSKTAITNEISRNSIKNIYCAETAHELYLSRRKSNNNKLSDRVKKLIIGLLKKKISPELICGRLGMKVLQIFALKLSIILYKSISLNTTCFLKVSVTDTRKKVSQSKER